MGKPKPIKKPMPAKPKTKPAQSGAAAAPASKNRAVMGGGKAIAKKGKKPQGKFPAKSQPKGAKSDEAAETAAQKRPHPDTEAESKINATDTTTENTSNGNINNKKKHKPDHKPTQKQSVSSKKTTAPTAPPKPAADLPKTGNEISSNWKALSKQLHIGEGKGKKKGPARMGDKKEKEKSKPEIWFDDVDIEDIEREAGQKVAVVKQTKKEKDAVLITGTFTGPTKHIGMDCEMVGVGFDGKKSVLARVAIVNSYGHVLYDKHVKPKENVTDYRTHVSGVLPEHLEDAVELDIVQKEVYDLLQGRVLVGHALSNDLRVLLLSHPKHMIRDTAKYKELRKVTKGRTPSLRRLTQEILGIVIQEGEHSPVEDARCAMSLYNKYKDQWEQLLRLNRKTKEKHAKAKAAKSED